MDKIKPDLQSSYLPVDITSLIREWSEGEQMGETSRAMELDDIFRWMRGTVFSIYGWANDGKGTFLDMLAMLKAVIDDWKFCFMKQEDISSTKYKNEPPKITANRIHKQLAWTYTGKTPYKTYAEKYNLKQVSRDEYMAALSFVDDHFKIVNPKDRRYKNVMDLFRFMYEKYGIDCFVIDPTKSLKLDDKGRTDFMMDEMMINAKDFSLETNSTFGFVAHPKSLTDVRQGKDPNSPFKVVTQFMVNGGSAWDNNMDMQYSLYRPERHLNPRDPKVHFHNLKTRNAEEMLIGRGVYEHIKFDPHQRRYFFNGICPLPTYGTVEPARAANIIDFTTSRVEGAKEINPDDLPF